jgi:hypothetical protein
MRSSLFALWCALLCAAVCCAAKNPCEFDAALTFPCYATADDARQPSKGEQRRIVVDVVVSANSTMESGTVHALEYNFTIPEELSLLDYSPRTQLGSKDAPAIEARTHQRARRLHFRVSSGNSWFLKGGRGFTLVFMAPRNWQAGLLELECKAFGGTRTGPRELRCTMTMAIGLYMADDAQAQGRINKAAQRRTQELQREGENPLLDEYALTEVRRAVRPVLFLNPVSMQFRCQGRTRFARDGVITDGRSVAYRVGKVTLRQVGVWNSSVKATQMLDRSEVDLTDADTGETFTLVLGQTSYLDRVEVEMTRRCDGRATTLVPNDRLPLEAVAHEAVLTHVDLDDKRCIFEIDGTLYEAAFE